MFYSFETSDGTSRQEFGHVLLPGTEDEHMKVNGSFSYLGPDGIFYEVRYTADDQGFHPEGDHIKVPPFVPWIHRHGPQADQDSNSPVYSDIQNNYNTVGTTPTPTTQYLPTYTTPPFKPTTQYFPLASNNPNYITGPNSFSTNTPRPTGEYLPTSPNPPVFSGHSDFSRSTPNPEITLFSTPIPQIQDN